MNQRAFTLIEILVVIGIIAILAGMGMSVAKPVMEKGKKSRASAEIVAFESALERYKADNGDYPLSEVSPDPETEGDPTSESYIAASRTLFQALCGRKNYKEAAEGQIYFEARVTQVDKNSRISTEEETYLVDPWGNAYGYHKNEANAGMNPGFFDLWTTSGSTEIEAKKQWIGNWRQ